MRVILLINIPLTKTGEISSKTNTWPISNTVIFFKQSYLFQAYISLNPRRVEQNIDLNRNAENCLFKMLKNKSSIFSNLTDKIWKLRF